MSSLKLKCVTGFGDKVSPVSEILKSQGWPVPPGPPIMAAPENVCGLYFNILMQMETWMFLSGIYEEEGKVS